MDTEEHATPQKMDSSIFWASIRGEVQKSASSVDSNKSGGNGGDGVGAVTPCINKKLLNPRTPNGVGAHSSVASTSTTNASTFQFFAASTTSLIHTPPAKRFQRVRNPFEAALADRLHLPLIASPSLFQRPTTPQLSSTQFEWTIDEVSSLQPVNLEPHETQFQDSPNPDYEAKAQSAISSYFKEQQIVPSPVDCPLRTHRIILSELNDVNTPISKPGRRIRDAGTQTELTLPAVLPPALEEALRPYFQPHLAGVGFELKVRSDADWQSKRTHSTDIKDISLRRKLFDMHGFIVGDAENRLPAANSLSSSPIQQSTLPSYNPIMGKLSDCPSLDRSGAAGSCGSLSPITANDWLSPHATHSATKRKSRLHSFSELGDLSPIRPLTPNVGDGSKSNSLRELYRTTANSNEQTNLSDMSVATTPARAAASASRITENGKFTPDRSSSPLNCLESTAVATAKLSVDSAFNYKVSRLVVNSSKRSAKRDRKLYTNEVEIFSTNSAADDTVDMSMVELDEEDDMQVSQLSAQSSNSSLSDTPRSKRRHASRKNLSQSFNADWLDAEESQDADGAEVRELPVINVPKLEEFIAAQTQAAPKLIATRPPPATHTTNFYRTDSGFNEMSCSSSVSYALSQSSTAALLHSDELSREASSKFAADEEEAAKNTAEDNDMQVCCSTPSKHAPAGVVVHGF